MKKSHVIHAVIAVVIIIIIGLFWAQKSASLQDYEKGTVVFHNTKIKVEIADNPITKYNGLSNRDEINDDEGMLFVYTDYSRPGFCMREMEFSLDIIWINEDKVVGIDQNLPLDNCKNYIYPPSLINYVLEVKAGFVTQNQIKIGDEVQINI